MSHASVAQSRIATFVRDGVVTFVRVDNVGGNSLSFKTRRNQLYGLLTNSWFKLAGIMPNAYGVLTNSRFKTRWTHASAVLTKFRWALCLLGATAVFLLANHLVLRGLAVGKWDADTQFLPYQILVADHARAGQLISWDVWTAGGLPILGDPQVGAFSPLNVLIGFITGGTTSGFVVYWLFIWWLGGVGILVLARHLGAPWWGGAIVASGYLFSGVYTGHGEHLSWVVGFSFLPLIIWRLDVALLSAGLSAGSRSATGAALEAGAIWGLSALSGYPALVICTGCFAALWSFGRAATTNHANPPRQAAGGNGGDRPPHSKERHGLETEPVPGLLSVRVPLKTVVWTLALFACVGLIVMLPTYFAFFYESAGTHRRVGALPLNEVVFNSFHPGALATFASPYLPILKFYNPEMWSYTDVSSCSVYMGVIPIVLAVLAVVNDPRSRWRWWLAALSLLSLGLAMGQTLPLREWLYYWFPPSRFFKHATIFRLYFMFFNSVLALIATADLSHALREPKNRRVLRRFMLVSCVLAIIALAAFTYYDLTKLNGGESRLNRIHAFLLWTGVCSVAYLCWRFQALSLNVLVTLLLTFSAIDAWQTLDLSRPLFLDTDAAKLQRWKYLDQKHSESLDLSGNGWRRNEAACYPVPAPCENYYLTNDQLITKIPVFQAYTTFENAFHSLMLQSPSLQHMAIGTERVWFAREVAHISPTTDNFNEFVKRAAELGTASFVVHSPNEMLTAHGEGRPGPDYASANPQINRLPGAERVKAEIILYTNSELAFNVYSPANGWLLITDRWAPSWRVKVNQQQALVYGGNFIFRAVRVQAGPNAVHFTYRPFAFPWLTMISWATLALVVTARFLRGAPWVGIKTKVSRLTERNVGRLLGRWDSGRR